MSDDSCRVRADGSLKLNIVNLCERISPTGMNVVAILELLVLVADAFPPLLLLLLLHDILLLLAVSVVALVIHF